jgi:hypothetical protein
MSETTPGNRAERFQTVSTILIAVVSTVIALVASQAAVASGNATEAQHNGVLAKINRERVDGATRVEIARNLRAFNTYRFNRSLHALAFEYIGQAEASGSSPQGTRLRLEAAGHLEESHLAYGFIDTSYLVADETDEVTEFDVENFINDRRQTAAIYQDINFDDDFEEAVRLRRASLGLNLSLLVWFVALMFLTWAEIARSALRWLWMGLGVLIALGMLTIYVVTSASQYLGLN